jgi:hypothetical protein
MKAKLCRPIVAACADPPRVREVSALHFLKIVGTFALVLIVLAVALVVLAARRSSDLPPAAANEESPPIVMAADLLPPKAGEVERVEPLELAALLGTCEEAPKAGPSLAAVCGQPRPQAAPPQGDEAKAAGIAATGNAADLVEPLEAPAAAPAAKPHKRPRGNLALAADAADNLPATPPGKLVKDRRLGTRLVWATSPESAAVQAQREGKLLFLLHLSGNFELPEFT